jgi:hypothetical protein
MRSGGKDDEEDMKSTIRPAPPSGKDAESKEKYYCTYWEQI